MSTVGIAIAMASLDAIIANTALPTIARDLGAEPAVSIWIVNSYQLALVVSLLPLASLGEIIGYRRVYLGGLALFTVASVVCALSWSLPSLVVARLLQGFGASGIMSVNTALIRFIYPRRSLGRGVGTNALIVGFSSAVGPTVASAILSVGSWPWLFAINLPLGVAAFMLATRSLPDTPLSRNRFDWISACLNAATFGCLILAMGEGAHRAGGLEIAIELAAGLCFGVLLLRRQAVLPAPMLPVDLFKRPLFALSAVTSFCSFAAQGSAYVALPFYLQNTLGRTQVETGLLMTPWPVVVAIMAPIAGRLSDRYPPGLMGACGLAALSAGLLLLAFPPAHPGMVDILWRMAVCGGGFGFFQTPNLRALMSSAPPERSGGASGIVATARLSGQTVGAALVALCFGLSLSAGPTYALALGAFFAGAASLASLSRMAVK